MRVDELIAAVRITGKLSTSDDDYTDARIRLELTNCCKGVFGAAIVAARAGAWCRQMDTEADGSRWRFRMPYRAFSMESVELVESVGDYEILQDQVVFDTAPADGTILRFTCYLAPSLLTQEQTAGAITTIDVDAGTVTVNSLPVNRVTAATIASGDKLDIVHPNGWHELPVVGATSTISSLVLTFADGTDLSDVEVGDYVRAAEQSDWPCIQDDFHACLADMTAARILRKRGFGSKADAIEKQAAGDLGRFTDTLEPRIKDAPVIAVPTGILLRRGRRRNNGVDTFQR